MSCSCLVPPRPEPGEFDVEVEIDDHLFTVRVNESLDEPDMSFYLGGAEVSSVLSETVVSTLTRKGEEAWNKKFGVVHDDFR